MYREQNVPVARFKFKIISSFLQFSIEVRVEVEVEVEAEVAVKEHT